MPRETFQAKKTRADLIQERLRQTYPNAHCELNYRNPLELLIATILSAQCTDKQVNIVTAQLFQKYRSAGDYVQTLPAELEQDLRAIGLYRNKARNIQACCRKLVEEHQGNVPASMEHLIELRGVGRKTANVVLGNAFNQNHGIVVDTHVARLSQRLGLSTENFPEKIETALQKLVPLENWTLFSHWLIWHGRRCCGARRPDCPHCVLRDLCPSAARLMADRPAHASS